MLNELQVPMEFVRNHANIVKAGIVETGKLLIDKTTAFAGLESLARRQVLDIGCGTRFTATIINQNIPIGSYTGVDVDKSIIGYLKENVEANDRRFDYAHWDVANALYNKEGNAELHSASSLPLEASRKFDMIWMFSVITHQYPKDSSALFRILRKHVKPDGLMFFTFLNSAGDEKFTDTMKDQPLMRAYYRSDYMMELLDTAGWKVEKHLPNDTQYQPQLHQYGLLCSPR